MNPRSVVTSKGQVTIPKPIREVAGIRESDLVEFEIRKGEVVMRPADGRFLTRFGSIPPREHPEHWTRVRRRVAEEVGRRAARIRRG